MRRLKNYKLHAQSNCASDFVVRMSIQHDYNMSGFVREAIQAGNGIFFAHRVPDCYD